MMKLRFDLVGSRLATRGRRRDANLSRMTLGSDRQEGHRNAERNSVAVNVRDHSDGRRLPMRIVAESLLSLRFRKGRGSNSKGTVRYLRYRRSGNDLSKIRRFLR